MSVKPTYDKQGRPNCQDCQSQGLPTSANVCQDSDGIYRCHGCSYLSRRWGGDAQYVQELAKSFDSQWRAPSGDGVSIIAPRGMRDY